MCFSRISPEPLELQKSFLHLFASLSKGLSDEILNPLTKSAGIFRNAALPEESKLLEKLCHLLEEKQNDIITVTLEYWNPKLELI